jgi:hypothetical protein
MQEHVPEGSLFWGICCPRPEGRGFLRRAALRHRCARRAAEQLAEKLADGTKINPQRLKPDSSWMFDGTTKVVP